MLWLMIAVLGLMLFSQVLLVLAESNPSHEIDHVEITPSGKIIYYKDGSKEAFFSVSANMGISANAVMIPNAVAVLPLDWIGLLQSLLEISGLVTALINLGKIVRGVLGFLRRLKWWMKYRKPRTPSDVSKYSLL